jgi:DNA-binding protein Fis
MFTNISRCLTGSVAGSEKTYVQIRDGSGAKKIYSFVLRERERERERERKRKRKRERER